MPEINTTVLSEYNKQSNIYAAVRDYLATYLNNLTIVDPNSILLQALALVEFSEVTSQLTRTAAVNISTIDSLYDSSFFPLNNSFLSRKNLIN